MKAFFKKYPALIFFIGAAVLITVIFVFYEVMYKRQNREQQKNYEELNKNAWVTEFAVDASENPAEETDPEIAENERKLQEFLEVEGNSDKYRKTIYSHPDFAEYLAINEEVVAYVLIPESKIDYPVLYNETEQDYYLKRNIDGSTGYPGCIYIENLNAPNLSDPVTVLYGHNMGDGTMFGALHDFFRKKGYLEEHPYIFVYQPGSVSVYETVGYTTYTDKHVLAECFEKQENEEFVYQGMPEDMQTRVWKTLKDFGGSGNYFSEAEVGAEDKLLILSTCSSDRRRALVVAKLMFTHLY